LRRALLHYCETRGYNGQVLPWKTVEMRIKDCAAVRATRPSEELLSEKLRRFARRTEMPSVGKLDQIRLFLQHEKFLTKDAFETEPDGLLEMIAARQYLANQTDQAEQRLSALDDRFIGVDNLNDGVLQETDIRLLRDAAGGYFYIEEQMKEYVGDRDQQRAVYRKEKGLRYKRTMTGYGFLATDLNLLYIFLRGASAKSRINYIEVPGEKPGYSIVLMRSGTPLQVPAAEATAEQGEWLKYNLVGLWAAETPPDQQMTAPP